MDYPTLGFAVAIMLVLYGVFREFARTAQIRLRTNVAMYREKNQVVHIEQMLDQIPRMMDELERMKIEMQARGATAEQLAPIQQRRQMLGQVQQFEPWLRMGGPVINKLLKWGLKLLG